MSLPLISVHPEGPRYRAPLLFVPGLWAGPGAWRRAASLLAHRGWEGWIADPGGRGGAAGRAEALLALVGELGRAPVVIAEDAGGLVAVEMARRVPLAAVVWVAPVLPGGAALRRMISPWQVLAGLVLRRPIGRPRAWTPEASGAEWVRSQEDAALVVDLVRARVPLGPLGVPVLLAAGADDPRCDANERAALVATLEAELAVLPHAGGTPLATGEWQTHAGAVHRWLVRRLGESVLELYAEAMAERDEE